MFDALLGGMLAGFGIAVPVGAISILIVGIGMREGFAPAASAGAGAATADLVYATIAVLAGAAAARLLEPWAGAISLVSALVLVAIALAGLWRAWRERVGDPPAEVPGNGLRRAGASTLTGTYLRFVGLTIINPLTIVYFTSLVLGSSAGTSPPPAEAAAFVAGAFVASLSWQTLLAAIGAVAHRGLPARFRLYTMIAGNFVILAIAVRILL